MLGTGFGLALATRSSNARREQTLGDRSTDELRRIAAEWDALSLGGKFLATLSPFRDACSESKEAQRVLEQRGESLEVRE